MICLDEIQRAPELFAVLRSLLNNDEASFYRISSGAEVDFVLEKAGRTVAIEIKSSTSPEFGKGNWSALDALQADQCYVVAPGTPYAVRETGLPDKRKSVVR